VFRWRAPRRFVSPFDAGGALRRHAAVLALGAALAGGCATAPATPGAAAPPTAALAATPAADDCAPPALAPAASASRFEIRSSFWLNLHNFLYKEARRRQGISDPGLGAKGNLAQDTLPGRPLDDAERRVWARALDYYERVAFDHQRFGDSLVIRINDRLTEAADGGDLSDVPLDPALRAALLDAAPVYRAAWWPAHDRRNAAWASAMRRLLERHEACLADRAASVFATAWQPTPIRVDATVYASWFGAYTTLRPPHVTVSSSAVGSQGVNGLEVLLHEGGHSLLARVDSALAATAARQGKRLPQQLSHLLLFYTAGELVREAVPEHVPWADAFGVWRRNAAVRAYRTLIEREWRPYLLGRATFADAVAGLVSGLPAR
jgi:hypothetical protein